MKCREVEDVLMKSGTRRVGRQTPSVQAHIEECPNCQEFARVVELPSGDIPMNANQIGHLQRMIVSNLRPVRPLPPSWTFLLAFLLFLVAFGCAGVLYLGPGGWFLLMPRQKISVFLTLATSVVLLAFSLVRQMVPGQKSLLRPGLLPAGVFVLLCLAVASVFQVWTDSHFLQSGETCLKAGLPYAIPAAFAFWLLLRRGAILSPRMVGATAGMLAGLVSMTVLEVHCPNLNMWHILVWHVGFALLGIVAGLLVATLGQAIYNRAP